MDVYEQKMGIILDLNGLEEITTGPGLIILLWYINNLIYIYIYML